MSGAKPVRLSTAALALVLALAAVGTLVLVLADGAAEVYVAARDLPAYHQLTQVLRVTEGQEDDLAGIREGGGPVLVRTEPYRGA